MDSYRIDKKSSSIVHGPGKCHDVRRPRTSTTREMDSYRIGRKSSSIPLQESSPRSQAHHDDIQCPESENRVRAFDPHAHTHTQAHTHTHTHNSQADAQGIEITASCDPFLISCLHGEPDRSTRQSLSRTKHNKHHARAHRHNTRTNKAQHEQDKESESGHSHMCDAYRRLTRPSSQGITTTETKQRGH